MIMKARYLLFAVAALALAACSKTNEQPELNGIQMTFRAYQEGALPTRTTVQDGGTQVCWEPADEIKVFFLGNGGRFVSQNTQNDAVAEFSGTLNVLVGLNEGASGSNELWGLYPYRADASSDGNSVSTTLPAEQTGRVGSFAKNTHITLSRSNSHDLAFYNVTGGVRFSLAQEGIKSVTFQGNNGEILAGKIKLTFEGGVPVVKEVTDGKTVLTLNAPGGGTFQTGQWYYIEAIPGTLSEGFKMVFSKGNEAATLNSSGSVTITRGRYGSITNADEGLIFKETGSGNEPDPSSVIQFADPIAKYACVEKFDTNGDQEVSYAEAAAATTLYGLFKDWNTVTSFDEIKYFTGVSSTSGVFSDLAQLKSITIPEFITDVGSFQNCSSLESITLPSGVKNLPDRCFQGCCSLISLNLPSGITTIPDYCFQNCTSLSSIDLPSGIKTIGSAAFDRCSSISSFDFPAALTNIGYYAFSECTSLISVSLATVVFLGDYAFNLCRALTSVVLPSGMTRIPTGLFRNCTALKTITWPTELKSIGDSVFEGCRFEGNNYTLELPSTVTSIGSGAFGLLHHIIIPSTSAVSISSNSFQANYTYLYVPAGMVEMYKVRTNWSNYKNQIMPIGDYPYIPKVGGTVGNAVDLGLSVKWASWNVGASSPEEYGTYFSWGETAPKWDYAWTTYKLCNGTWNTLTKYYFNSSYGTVDNKTVLDPEDDAAHVNWGGSWRMPTLEECEELINKCTWTWTSQNGVNGRLVTGPNGKSIFLPAAGSRNNTYLSYAGSFGYYWSSSLYTGGPSDAYLVYFDSDSVYWYGDDRYDGRSVRPVTE